MSFSQEKPASITVNQTISTTQQLGQMVGTLENNVVSCYIMLILAFIEKQRDACG